MGFERKRRRHPAETVVAIGALAKRLRRPQQQQPKKPLRRRSSSSTVTNNSSSLYASIKEIDPPYEDVNMFRTKTKKKKKRSRLSNIVSWLGEDC